MRRFGLIGYPLSHSFSAKFFSEKFQKESVSDATYELFPLEHLVGFKKWVNSQSGLKGFNVTIPYKQEIIRFLDVLEMDALKIGAVNCVKVLGEGDEIKLKGFNTDHYGFEQSLKKLQTPLPKKALILGTGGSAQAVSFALSQLGIDVVFISRKPNACKTIRYAVLNEEIMQEHKLIINTTPLGMSPEMDAIPDIPYQFIGPDHILIDLIYNPAETRFLQRGKAAGAETMNGLEMLYQQAERSWEIWNNNSFQ